MLVITQFWRCIASAHLEKYAANEYNLHHKFVYEAKYRSYKSTGVKHMT